MSSTRGNVVSASASARQQLGRLLRRQKGPARKREMDEPEPSLSAIKKDTNGHDSGKRRRVKGSKPVDVSTEVVDAPYKYIAALPSKKVRETFIDGMNVWLRVPEAALETIKGLVTILHNSSLMFDDIEDNSKLRRGKPAAHVLYGTPQTINSAVYALVNSFSEVQKLHSPAATSVFTEELKNLHCGQSLDLYWKYNQFIPTVDEYMEMVDNKTGGLFRMCVGLMESESDVLCDGININRFVNLLGRYFQIRDDYQNLMSAEYINQKGFCEDLDEGKVSLPLIYYLSCPGSRSAEVKSLLFHRPAWEELPFEMKEFIIDEMKAHGALAKTFDLLKGAEDELLAELHHLEARFKTPNPILHTILNKLRLAEDKAPHYKGESQCS